LAIIKCPECNKEVSNQAPTCIHCGFSLRGQPDTPAPWETCQIEWGNTAGLMGAPIGSDYFWVQATSPVTGTYCAGESSTFRMGAGHYIYLSLTHSNDLRPKASDGNATRPHAELIDALIKDGWEPTEIRGREWWQHSFRRRVRREEDGWLVITAVAKWGGRWEWEPEIPDDVAASDWFQENVSGGRIRKEGQGFWVEEHLLIDYFKTRGVELVSSIQVDRHGTCVHTFRTPKETSDDLSQQEPQPDAADTPSQQWQSAAICPQCKTPNPPSKKLCRKCGSDLPPRRAS
jgi:ribosomal protein L40E